MVPVWAAGNGSRWHAKIGDTMGALTLVVDRRGSRLELAQPGVVKLTHDNGDVQRIGVQSLATVAVVGDAVLSATLLRALSNAGVGMVLLPSRGPGPGAYLLPSAPARGAIRIAQLRAYDCPTTRLAIARDLVDAKIAAQSAVALARGLRASLDHFRRVCREAASLPELMGVEGAAAARYFGAWQHAWPAPFEFQGRSRRPPRDPVNALLSLGYSMALGTAARLAATRGLDVATGFLHGPERGRPSLALDLLEPLRAAVDHWVWHFLAAKLAEPKDFTLSDQDGCRLAAPARSRFFSAWHEGHVAWLEKPARRVLALVLRRVRRHLPRPPHSAERTAP